MVSIAAAVVLVPGVIVRHHAAYHPLGVQVACYLVPAAVVCNEVYLLLRRRPWGRKRWPALVLVLTATLLSQSSLPASSVAGAQDWAFGTTGWVLLILTLDQPLILFLALLGTHAAITTAAVLRAADRGTLLNLAAGSIGAIGYPLATGLASAILADVARTMTHAARAAVAVRSAEADRAHLHVRRQQRFADLDAVAQPLLEGLADGSLDPADPDVQRACTIATARIRRLIAESDSVNDALLHELREGADVAERLGVLVELHTRGTWTDPPAKVRRALLDPVLVALTRASGSARVTVVGLPGMLSVSVVADCRGADVPVTQDADVTVSATAGGDMTWVEATWTPPATPPRGAASQRRATNS